MKRRELLKTATATAGALAIHPLATWADSVPSDAPQEADVIVVGGGTAGTIAAIQAARAGAKTVLIEHGSQLGGTTTVGGVAFPGLFHAWGKQIISGIGWELVEQTVTMDGGKLPDFARPTPRHWQHQVLINPFLYCVLAEEACLRSGVTIHYYEFPHSVQEVAGGWLVESVGPGTRRRLTCRQLIDCTGGADIVGMLKLPRLREEETQPGSMLFKFGGDAFRAGRERLQAVYVHGADSSTSATRTQATLAGRQAMLKQLRKRLQAGDGQTRLLQMQPEAAFRESYRILGETVITREDYASGRRFEDAVCNAFYPIDLHTQHGVRPKPLASGVVPTVPLRALVPKGSRNLLVAGRSVSSDRLANSGLRVQASCMAMGQAAGVTATLAAQHRTTPLDVPFEEIQRKLRDHGAIVPGSA
ncbi:MAG: FAD-dependent oxidoreductase [Candidatus Nealsonbacteria bacterium]|nr:FAD-dependent oxidoreductase [Candidatus Nealsonbacteria bacterium]